MTMLPFQCVLYCDRKDSPSLIVAASGNYIYSFAASTGLLLSSWSQTARSSHVTERCQDHILGTSDYEIAGSERPVKRRRLSGLGEVSDSTSAEIVIDNDAKKPRRRKANPGPVLDVISIIVNSTGKHIVAVTGEDKCIRVLEVLADGWLHQISERYAAGLCPRTHLIAEAGKCLSDHVL